MTYTYYIIWLTLYRITYTYYTIWLALYLMTATYYISWLTQTILYDLHYIIWLTHTISYDLHIMYHINYIHCYLLHLVTDIYFILWHRHTISYNLHYIMRLTHSISYDIDILYHATRTISHDCHILYHMTYTYNIIWLTHTIYPNLRVLYFDLHMFSPLAFNVTWIHCHKTVWHIEAFEHGNASYLYFAALPRTLYSNLHTWLSCCGLCILYIEVVVPRIFVKGWQILQYNLIHLIPAWISAKKSSVCFE